MTPVATDIRFLLGDRCILRARRMLVPLAYGLDAILADRPLTPAPLPGDADGYRVQSAPASQLARLDQQFPGFLKSPPQVYARHYIDMALGHDGYMAQFSSKTRATLKRKMRKLADADGGTLDIRSYHAPDRLDAFFAPRCRYRTRPIRHGCLMPGCRAMPPSVPRQRRWPGPTTCAPGSCSWQASRSPISICRWSITC